MRGAEAVFDSDAVRQIFSVEGAAWTSTLALILLVARLWNGAPAMLDRWLAWRAAKAAEKAADWSRLRDEVIRLSEAEHRCRNELADVTRRLATLEGYNIGRGKAVQEASTIVAVDRLENHARAPKSAERFGENGGDK